MINLDIPLFEKETYPYIKNVVRKTLIEISEDDKESKSEESKRKVVLNWLKIPSLNKAEIMRQLWNPSKDEEDAKRSYFYKCADGKLNDDGIPYQFSLADINSLFRIKSNSK